MFEHEINSLFSNYTAIELDQLIKQCDDPNNGNTLLQPFEISVRAFISKMVASILRQADGLVKIEATHPSEVRIFVDLLKGFFHSAELPFENLRALFAEWKSVVYASEELSKTKEVIAQNLYAYLVCSKFLVPRSNYTPTTNYPALQNHSLTFFIFLENIYPTDEYLREVSLRQSLQDGELKKHQAEELSKICEISNINTFSQEIEAILSIMSSLRQNILKVAFSDFGSKPFEYSVQMAEKGLKLRNFDSSIAARYGRFLIDNLLQNPRQVCNEHLQKIVANFDKASELARLEKSMSIALATPNSWRVSPSLFNIDEFKKAFNLLQDPEGLCLISTFFSKPIGWDYDLNESLSWATGSALNSYIPAKKETANLHLVMGNTQTAISILRTLAEECIDSEIEYTLASILIPSNNEFERELGRKLAASAAEQNHPGALCLCGRLSQFKWISGSDEDLHLALAYYEKSAEAGFGRAKVEIELYKLREWTRSSTHRETQNLPEVDAKELDMYEYLKTSNARNQNNTKWRQDLAEMASQTTLLTNKYLIGNLLGSNDAGIEILEQAGEQGHPQACAKLSEIYEKQLQDDSRALQWHESLLRNDLMYRGVYRDRFEELYRTHSLKQKIYALPSVLKS